MGSGGAHETGPTDPHMDANAPSPKADDTGLVVKTGADFFSFPTFFFSARAECSTRMASMEAISVRLHDTMPH